MKHRIAIFFILFSWGIYGFTINASDLRAYGLYHVGTESIVEYGTYTIGHSRIPGWKDAGDGDVFEYNHQRFPAKQPGAFFFTAIPYFILNTFFGISFSHQQDLAAALNCWLSETLIASIAVGLFYEILLLFRFSPTVSTVTTLSFAFGTIFFPYTGIPHHDIYATSCLVFSLFYLLHCRQRKLARNFYWSGAWLGLTLFFSMLPALLVSGLLVYGLSLSQNWKNRFRFFIGFALGYLPVGIFNWWYFGNPFIQANMAGNYQDTFFKFSFDTMITHYHDYFGITSYLSALQCMPVFILGLVGLCFIPSNFIKEKILFLFLCFVHLFYLLNISTIGHCQFGPRYLIPLMPFTMIGLGFLLSTGNKWIRKTAISFAGITIPYSIAVNSLGAIGDTMFCGNLVESPIRKYWNSLDVLESDHFYIRPYSGVVFLLALLFLFWSGNRFPPDRLITELD